MFMLMQKVLNLSEIKLSSQSNIIFFGSPYSAKITLNISIRLSADKPSVFFFLFFFFLIIGNLL